MDVELPCASTALCLPSRSHAGPQACASTNQLHFVPAVRHHHNLENFGAILHKLLHGGAKMGVLLSPIVYLHEPLAVLSEPPDELVNHFLLPDIRAQIRTVIG